LTKKDDDGGLGAEVSDRLDELFGDEDSDDTPMAAASPAAISKAKSSPKKAAKADTASLDDDSPIKNLKALVFSIDWEITDETMVDYLKEIKRLKKKYKGDKILSFFLKLHESIGKYIKAKKARAHPDAMKFVASVFKNFEKILLNPGMTEKKKKQLLTSEVKKFKDFKQRVLIREDAMGPAAVPAAAEEKVHVAEVVATPDSGEPGAALSLETKEALDYIVEQLKKEIKAEFHTIRQIIKNLGA